MTAGFEEDILDADPDDRHVYGIDWGPGEPFRTGRAVPPGKSPEEGRPTFVQSADGTGVLVDRATYFSNGPKTVTVCFSDTPELTALASCRGPNVTAVASRVLNFETRVPARRNSDALAERLVSGLTGLHRGDSDSESRSAVKEDRQTPNAVNGSLVSAFRRNSPGLTPSQRVKARVNPLWSA